MIGVELCLRCKVLLSTYFSCCFVPDITTSVLPFLQLILSSLSAIQLSSELKSSSRCFWVTSNSLSEQRMTISSAYINIPLDERLCTASLKCRRNQRGPRMDPCGTPQYMGYSPEVVPWNDICFFPAKR